MTTELGSAGSLTQRGTMYHKLLSAASIFLAVIIAAITALTGPASASETYTASVKFLGSRSASTDLRVRVSVQGVKFSAIEQACFIFSFQGDLLDPGDELQVDPGENVGTFGFKNTSTASQSDRAICIVSPGHDAMLATLKDGKQVFSIGMVSGSVNISSLAVTIIGTRR